MNLRENIKIHLDKLSDTAKASNKNVIDVLYEKADMIDKIEDVEEMGKQAMDLMKKVDMLVKFDSNMTALQRKKDSF